MNVKWASFLYRPDGSGEFEPDAITPPDQLCQTERHMMSTTPAAWLEVLCTPDSGGMTVHRAWFTCTGCHAALEADYDPELNPGAAE